MDNHLLLAMHSTYFPTRILRPSENEFQVGRFINQILLRGFGAPLKITVPSQSYTLAELNSVQWPDDEPEIEDLLYRYFFSRIFGKLYFGAGFGQLTVIAGFHHLVLVYALLKLQCKALAKPSIDPIKCKGCTACARKCPVGAISGEKKKPHVIDQTKCIVCGVCADTCKLDAVVGV